MRVQDLERGGEEFVILFYSNANGHRWILYGAAIIVIVQWRRNKSDRGLQPLLQKAIVRNLYRVLLSRDLSKGPISVGFAKSIVYQTSSLHNTRLEDVLLDFINTTFDFDPSRIGNTIIAQLMLSHTTKRIAFSYASCHVDSVCSLLA